MIQKEHPILLYLLCDRIYFYNIILLSSIHSFPLSPIYYSVDHPVLEKQH